MHATVNTNASSALNTQKSINSYDGGVQPLVLSSAIIEKSAGTGANAIVWTATIPATASPLDEVSDIVFDLTGLDEAGQTVLKTNTQGLTLKITGSISSTAPASANTAALKLARFKELFDVKNNVWECVDIKYVEGSSSATAATLAQVLGQYLQKGTDRFNRGSMTLNTPLVQDALTFQIQKVQPAIAATAGGLGAEQRISHITLRRRRRGLALPS